MSRPVIDYDEDKGVFTYSEDGQLLSAITPNELRGASNPQLQMELWIMYCTQLLRFNRAISGIGEQS